LGGVFADFFAMSNMADEGSRRPEKRSVFVDLDAPENLEQQPVESAVPSQSSNPSSSSAKKRKGSKKPDNPLVPPHEYILEARRIGLQYYERRSSSMLSRTFINLNEEGYHKLCREIHDELVKQFEGSEVYNDWTNFWDHAAWLDKQVTALTTNIKAVWTYHTKKKPDGSDWSLDDHEFVSKIHMVQDWCQRWSSSRGKKIAPWKATLEDDLIAHCVSGTFKWLETSVKPITMPDRKTEGAYGTVKKVMLTKIEHIPSWVPFACKTLKTKNEKEKRQMIVSEAGGCPVKHPGIIRLAFLHPRTMDGYTLWWNGGSLKSFWENYDRKVPENLEHNDIQRDGPTDMSTHDLKRVATYRRKRLDLALSLLVIVGKCHEANYIHNDITPTNILLHFDEWKEDTVYIGICDWGISSRVVEQEPSKYGYPDQAKLEEEKRNRRWVAPELFYRYGEHCSETSLDIMQAKHLYSKAADAYSTGYIAEKIWQEDWNPKYFTTTNKEQYENLLFRLKDLQKPNVRERATVPDVLDLLRKKPHCWTMPACCFRT